MSFKPSPSSTVVQSLLALICSNVSFTCPFFILYLLNESLFCSFVCTTYNVKWAKNSQTRPQRRKIKCSSNILDVLINLPSLVFQCDSIFFKRIVKNKCDITSVLMSLCSSVCFVTYEPFDVERPEFKGECGSKGFSRRF